MPLPDTQRRQRQRELQRASRRSTTSSSRSTRGKVEHKFTDKVSLTGFYLYNRTDEPCSNYFEPGLNGPNRFADPHDYLLKRRPQILALNNTWVLERQLGAGAALRLDAVSRTTAR